MKLTPSVSSRSTASSATPFRMTSKPSHTTWAWQIMNYGWGVASLPACAGLPALVHIDVRLFLAWRCVVRVFWGVDYFGVFVLFSGMSVFRFSAEFRFFFLPSAFLKMIFRFFLKNRRKKTKKKKKYRSPTPPLSGGFKELR